MKNLYKNVIRSFSKNKISIIGLSFLVFFGVGSFCVLSNTTTNISTEYNSIATMGAMHDLTISELYNVGSPGYQTNNGGIILNYDGLGTYTWRGVDTFWTEGEGQVRVGTTQLTTRNLEDVDEAGTYYFPIPDQIMVFNEEDNIETYLRTYHITLDKDLSTGLYSSFAEYGQQSIKSIDIKVTESFDLDEVDVPEEITALQNAWYPSSTGPKVPISNWTNTTFGAVTESNIFSRDFNKFNTDLNNQTSIIYNTMTTSNTPVTQWIDSDESGLKNDLTYRYFKSINITGTDEGIFYKVVKSDPTDTIDKMVLFEDPNKLTGNKLFDENDYAPYDSQIIIYDKDKKPYTPGSVVEDIITIPATFEDIVNQKIENINTVSWSDEVKSVYAQIVRIRFKRMASGDNTSKDPETGILPLLKKLSANELTQEEYTTQLFDANSQLHNYYNTYYDEVYIGNMESIAISANSNIIFTWTEPVGTIQTCTISNWTSRFSIANPQYLKNSKKTVILSSSFGNFKPFAEWYKATYKRVFEGEITQKVAIGWFNSLNSDQFGFWINPFTKGDEWSQMVYDNIPNSEPITIERGEEPGKWNGINQNHILKCGGFDQIIWGCGLTPDFMYPVVDISRPTPNPKTECITYCNNVGYKTIKLAYLNAPVEEYLVCKFRANAKTSRQTAVNKINEWAKTHMTYPTTTKAAYLSTDTSNVLNASSFRIAYIPSLVNVIRVVTIVLSSFIGILCLLICAIIIKRYVENNRINIGIMRANGISKGKIALSMLPFALFPAVVGGISAYFIGFFLQAPALLLFSNYWMLPTPLLGFSPWAFCGCIFLPFILFAIISTISTLIVLKTKTVDLMKSGSEFKASAFSRAIKKPFKHFGILTRFRVSLAFNSLLRLSMLAVMSTLTMSSLVFAMSTFNRLSQAQKTNSSQFEYNFNVELVTPTTSGGPYSYYDVSKNELGTTNSSQYVYNTAWDTSNIDENYSIELTKPYQAIQLQTMQLMWDLYYTDVQPPYRYYDMVAPKGQLQLPNIADATGQLTDLTYLQNRVNSRLLLDYNIGVSSITSNPWEIALALMPANSRNIAADSYNKIIQSSGEKVYSAEQGSEWFFDDPEQPGRNVYKDYYLVDDKDPDHPLYTLNTAMSVVGFAFSSFNPGYLSLLLKIYSTYDLIKEEYPISYGMVPINFGGEDVTKDDELYTYVKANIDSISSKARIDKTHEIKIEGIIQDSQYIKLTDKKGNNLNERLYGMNENVGIHECPVVINAYAAHKYKLKTNDTISITATNTADRFERHMHEDDFKDDDSNKAILRIVGISQGTNDEAFYITQKDANDILGLPDGSTWNKTHKYMLWTDRDKVGREWTKGDYLFTYSNLPHLMDLSNANPDATENERIVYGFDSETGKPIVRNRIDIFNTNIPVGFNGVYTQNPQGKPVTSYLPLYSYSGMYPGTSVFQASGQNKMTTLLKFGNNLALANLMSGLNKDKYYQECASWVTITDPTPAQDKNYTDLINKEFLPDIVDAYGETTMIVTLCGAMDVAASDQIYTNLISTFNLAEVSIMAIIIPITIIIVGIISNLIINDSKKMAAMLKALGYSDSKNAMSILALFVPTIIIGLLLAIPLSFGLLAGYQSIIFSTANILVDVSQQWWYYAIATAGIGVILVTTYVVGFVSLKKDRLVDQIK